jgi:hypothetical protein
MQAELDLLVEPNAPGRERPVRRRTSPRKKTRPRKSIKAWQIPRCDGWSGEPGTPTFRVCRMHATHRIDYDNKRDHSCDAHLGMQLHWADKYVASERRWFFRQLDDVAVYLLTFPVDAKAAAYGRHRYVPIEEKITGVIAPPLF